MQRTVYDATMTPGQARAIEPALASQYPRRTHDTTVIPHRIGNLRRVRIVVQLKARRARW